MSATAGSTRRAHEETVRLRLGDLPPLLGNTTRDEAKTVRMRPADLLTRRLPKAISAFDGKTVRQRYANLSKKQRLPTKWEIARLALVLLLASMPILGISADVSGLVSQSTTSVAVIVLTAVLGTLVVFAPHRLDMIVGRGLITGMVACIVYDGARLFAVHVLGLMGDFIPVMGS